jgi:hypothetical protein
MSTSLIDIGTEIAERMLFMIVDGDRIARAAPIW